MRLPADIRLAEIRAIRALKLVTAKTVALLYGERREMMLYVGI